MTLLIYSHHHLVVYSCLCRFDFLRNALFWQCSNYFRQNVANRGFRGRFYCCCCCWDVVPRTLRGEFLLHFPSPFMRWRWWWSSVRTTKTKSCKNSVCSRNSPQPCLDPPKSEWHDGQRQINEAGNCIRENTALRTKFRGGVWVQACHAAVWIEIVFGRLGVMTTQASWLAQVGSGALIGQRACWLMM